MRTCAIFDHDLAEALVAMAEAQLAAQGPLADLLERDEAFANWVERVVVAQGKPLTVAEWDHGEPPSELVAIRELTDSHDERLAAIVRDRGWPGRSLVGEDGADSAWLIAQHADRHQEERRTWIPPLQRAVAVREADGRHLGRLVDRVALIDGELQQYGTYCRLTDMVEIEWEFPPEGSLAEIDARRRAIGLPALLDDLRESPEAGPYRHLRSTPAYQWPTPT